MATENNNKNLNVPNLRFPEFSGEWERKKLGDIGTTLIGLTYSPQDVVPSDGTIVLRSSNIKGGLLDYTDLVKVNKKIKESIITRTNDILICARNGSARLIGKNAILKDSDCGHTFGAFMMVYRSEDNPFVHQLLSTKRYYSQVAENLGARINQITTSDLNSFEFSFPQSKKEKVKIASMLSLLDERIATQIKIIEDLKKLKSAISNKLFARKDLLEKQIAISEVGTLKNGYAFQSSSYNPCGRYKIITIANVPGTRYVDTENCSRILSIPKDIQQHQILTKGDILISLTGNVGRVSLCDEGEYLLNQRVGLLQLKTNVDSEYIYQALSHSRFERSMISCGQGAAQMNIGKSDVEDYFIPYSNNIAHLSRIASILKAYDSLIIYEYKRLNLFNKQKQYLLAQMFI